VKGVWIAVDAGGLENKKILEKEIILNAETLKGVKEKDRVDFTLSHDNPYPKGDYKIDIYLNRELADTVEFTIE
jgi:outer membrane usher protein FimD/PapC